MTKEFKINVEVTITAEMIEEIIVGALEGGSNYWYLLGDEIPPKDGKGTPLSERICNEVLNSPEYKLPIYDFDEPLAEEVIGYLTQEGMLNAFRIVSEKYPWHYTNMVSECADAETYDVFFQCAVLGDIVYG